MRTNALIIFTTSLQSGYCCCFHFTDGETEAQSCQAFAQGHRASKQRNQDSNIGILVPMFLITLMLPLRTQEQKRKFKKQFFRET